MSLMARLDPAGIRVFAVEFTGGPGRERLSSEDFGEELSHETTRPVGSIHLGSGRDCSARLAAVQARSGIGARYCWAKIPRIPPTGAARTGDYPFCGSGAPELALHTAREKRCTLQNSYSGTAQYSRFAAGKRLE